MRFSLCTEPENLASLINAKADYIECTVTGLNERTDEELATFSAELAKNNFRCETLAILFPGGRIPLVGDNADLAGAEAYVENAFARIHGAIKPEVIVFGSGGARRCPEGFNKETALGQFVEAGQVVAQAAQKYGITIALEPLNKDECNLINSVAEGLAIVKRVNRPNFRILADFYHMLRGDEPPEALLQCEGILAHTHIAAKEGRRYPQAGDKEELVPYLNMLKKIGYNGRVSIEGRGEMVELGAAFEVLREWVSAQNNNPVMG